jgi:hypothetical protein
MTAFSKPGNRVRGIVTGCTFRRVVARALARQFAAEFEPATAPFQFALRTRAGTDAMGHLLRATTDADPEAVLLSLDGIGAYDHVHRAEILQRLHDDDALRPLLPFVRMSYDRVSRYVWTDEAGVAHVIQQGEGANRAIR